MLSIDVSSLSLAELRQLSGLARARGQSQLADALTAELKARTQGAPPLFPPPRVRPRRRSQARRAWVLAASAALALALGLGVPLPV